MSCASPGGVSGEGGRTPSPGGIVYDEAAVEGGWETVERGGDRGQPQREGGGGVHQHLHERLPRLRGRPGGGQPHDRQRGRSTATPSRWSITRDDTGEAVYTSAAIPVGSKIAADALDAVLAAGTYECTAMFHCLDPETGAALGSAGASIVITIQN